MSKATNNTSDRLAAMDPQTRVELAEHIANLECLRESTCSGMGSQEDAAIAIIGTEVDTSEGQRCWLQCRNCGAALVECPCEGQA